MSGVLNWLLTLAVALPLAACAADSRIELVQIADDAYEAGRDSEAEAAAIKATQLAGEGNPEIAVAHYLLMRDEMRHSNVHTARALGYLRSIQTAGQHPLFGEEVALYSFVAFLSVEQPDQARTQLRLACNSMGTSDITTCANGISDHYRERAFGTMRRLEAEKYFLFSQSLYVITGDKHFLARTVEALGYVDFAEAVRRKQIAIDAQAFDATAETDYCAMVAEVASSPGRQSRHGALISKERDLCMRDGRSR